MTTVSPQVLLDQLRRYEQETDVIIRNNNVSASVALYNKLLKFGQYIRTVSMTKKDTRVFSTYFRLCRRVDNFYVSHLKMKALHR